MKTLTSVILMLFILTIIGPGILSGCDSGGDPGAYFPSFNAGYGEIAGNEIISKGYNHLPIVYVAAANSSTEARNAAQYLGDNVNDEITISAAITALGDIGGTVILLPGTYTTVNTITYDPQTTGKVRLSGFGAVIDHNSDGSDWAITAETNLSPSIYWYGGGTATALPDRYLTIEGLTIYGNGTGYGGIRGVCHHSLKIDNCTIIGYSNGKAIEGLITAALNKACEHWTITNCHLAENRYSMYFAKDALATETSFNGLYISNIIASNSQRAGTIGMLLDGSFAGATISDFSFSPIFASGTATMFDFRAGCANLEGVTIIAPLLDIGTYGVSGTRTFATASCNTGNKIAFINYSTNEPTGGAAYVEWNMGSQDYWAVDSYDGSFQANDYIPFADDVLVSGSERLYVFDIGGEYILGDGSYMQLVGGGQNSLSLENGEVTIQQMLNFNDGPTEFTISGSAVTVTETFCSIDTEGDAAEDYLCTINGGSNGDLLILHPANGARTVIFQDRVGGTDNLLLEGNFTGDDTRDVIGLIYWSSYWMELFRSNNA